MINFFDDTIELGVNPFYNHVFSDHCFVVTLTNYDLNMYLLLFNKFAFLSCLSTLESYYYFLFFSTGFIVVSLHKLNTKPTLTLPKETAIYKILIYSLHFLCYNHIYTKKKTLQIFCAANECDSDSKK